MNKVFLNALLRAFSPSGYEENATQVVQNYLDGVANFEFIDKVGNAAFSVGSGDVKIMLSVTLTKSLFKCRTLTIKVLFISL